MNIYLQPCPITLINIHQVCVFENMHIQTTSNRSEYLEVEHNCIYYYLTDTADLINLCLKLKDL